MEWFAKLPEQLATRFRSLSKQNRIAAALFCVAILVGTVFFAGGSGSGETEPLFGGRTFSYGELAEMTAAFRDAGLLDSEIRANQMYVPSEEKDLYLVALQSTDTLPSAFDESVDEAVANNSPFKTGRETEMSFRHAEQKKLARIVASLSGIESASVQYDEVKKGGFPPTVEVRAFVAVRAVGGRELSFEQIEAIRDTVAGYVAGAERSDVTVTDLSACRAYPGSYDRDGAMGASLSYLSKKRIMERELRQKIQQRLEVYPGVAVGVDIHLSRDAPSTSSVDADRSDTEGQFVPSQVTISVGLPKSHAEGIWRDRMGVSSDLALKGSGVLQIEQETEADIQRAVLAMLPPSDLNAQDPHHVTVTFYTDALTSAGEGLTTDSAGARLLAGNELVAVLGLIVLVGGVLCIGWKYRSVRIRVERRAGTEPDCVESPLPDAEDSVTSEISATQDPSTDVHEEITRIVSQNPQAAAELIRKWLDRAA